MRDRLLELPDVCLRKIIRELIFYNDGRNIRRAYKDSLHFIKIFEDTWQATLTALKVYTVTVQYNTVYSEY